MRKLPLFFVVDVSESIAGPAHDAIVTGIEGLLRNLRTDPQALETVHLSIIVFAGRARVLVPMMELSHFHPPALPIGGGTSLGAALATLMDEIDLKVVRGSAERRGDWKPLVFLMTDGHPTDRPEPMIERWRARYAARARLVAVSIGGGADHALLRRLTEEVVVLADAAPDTLVRFFEWMSQSVAVQSRAVGERTAGSGVDLSKTLPDGAAALDPDAGSVRVDDRVAVFVARCQHSEAPYLMRYERVGGDGGGRYALRQTISLKPSYFELSSDDGAPAGTISTANLAGMPGCPHCGTRIGLVACSCGRLHCIDGPGTALCPWCGQQCHYTPAPEGTELDLSRGAG